MNYMFGNNEECSSGCESGWTIYFEQSSISPCDRENDSPVPRRNRVFTDARRSNEDEDEDEEEDEDLSMVSDASSGPAPHLHEEEEEEDDDDKNGCFYNYTVDRSKLIKRNKNRENRCRSKVKDHSSLLDDTASSPFLDLCNKTRSQPSSTENVLEYSQGYSTTQFEEVRSVRPPYQEHYDFFQSGNHQNQWFEGKRW